MLGPTHEEEITTLVANTLKSYKDLPIKLYQTCMFSLPMPYHFIISQANFSLHSLADRELLKLVNIEMKNAHVMDCYGPASFS
jgi:hypothetical protein